MNPDIYLLLIVKNPVGRTISSFHMAKRNKKFNKTLESSWKKYARFYDESFVNWLVYFRRKQIHIVDGDSLIDYPVPELSKIEEFLSIERFLDDKVFVYNSTKGFFCLKQPSVSQTSEEDIKCLAENKGHTNFNVSSTVLEEMKDFFRPHNQRFFDLCQRRFDWDL